MAIDEVKYQTKAGPVVKYRVRKSLMGKRGPTWGTYSTREEAEDQNRICNAITSNAANYTLKTFGESLYIVDADRSLQCKWKNHVLNDPISQIELSGITKNDCRGWFKRQLETKLRAAVIGLHVVILRRAFKLAVDEDKIVKSPMDGLTDEIKRTLWNRKALEDAQGKPKARAELSHAELMRIATCEAIPEHARLRIVIFSLQGWRKGEFSSLKLEDLRLDCMPPFADIKTGGLNKPRKSRKPYRSIILPETVPYLKRWLEILPSYCHTNKLGLVFPAVQGGYAFNPFSKTVKRNRKTTDVNQLRIWLALAGIKRRVRTHDLRRTGATLLALSGAPLAVIQRHLGHATMASTMGYVAASTDDYARHVWAGAPAQSDRIAAE